MLSGPGNDKVGDPLSGTRGPRAENAASRFAELGLELPEIPPFPPGQRPLLKPIVVHNGLAYISGIGPLGTVGVVGGDLDVEAEGLVELTVT